MIPYSMMMDNLCVNKLKFTSVLKDLINLHLVCLLLTRSVIKSKWKSTNEKHIQKFVSVACRVTDFSSGAWK